MSDQPPEKLTPEQVMARIVELTHANSYTLDVSAVLRTANCAVNVTRSLIDAGIAFELVLRELAPAEK